MLPRYFVPVGPEPAPLPPGGAPLLAHLRDVLRLGAGGPEAVVGADLKGRLRVVSAGVPDGLPAALRQALVHHEVARGRPARTIDAAELWLLEPHAVEQPVNTPGLNDPVVIRGRLYGPFGDVRAPVSVEGQLTVTRGDLLAGVVDELGEAFWVHGPGGDDERCFHALLPGDTAEVVARGEGLILLCPALPTELDASDTANEPLVKRLLFDLLAAMQADLRAVDPAAPFAARALPLPSRADLERELEAEGWEIQGDRAVRLDPSLRRGIGSLLTSVLGVPDAMTRALPPEGTLDELVAAARDALATLPGWPDARSRALRQRVLATSTGRPALPSPPDPPPIPRATATSPGPADPPRPTLPAGPPDWEEDFAAPPAGGSRPPARRPAPPSRVTRFDERPGPAARPAMPDWMKDFSD